MLDTYAQREGTMRTQSQSCDWSDESTRQEHQGMLSNNRNQKRQGRALLQSFQREQDSAHTLILNS